MLGAPMKRPPGLPGRRGRPLRWALGAWLAYARAASAQTPPSGWALDRYEPSPAGDVFFLAELPWYRSTRALAAGITLGYAAGPLGVRIPRDGLSPREHAVVSGMLTGHLGVAFAPLDRLGVHLSLPLTLDQSGAPIPSGLGNVGPAAGIAPGDLRAGIRVRLVGEADRDPWSLHLGALVWLPTGSPSDNTGDGSARAEARVVLAGRAAWLRWSVGAGFHLRGAVDALNLAVGNELRVTAALGLSLLRGRLHVGPEGYLFSSVRDLPNRTRNAAFTAGQWGAEVMLGARWRIADAVQVGLAGGIGIGAGYGVPEGRALLAIAYAPGARSTGARPTPRRIVASRNDASRPPAAPVAEPPRAEPRPAVEAPAVEAPVLEEPVLEGPVLEASTDGAVARVSGGFVRSPFPVDFRAHRARVSGAQSYQGLDAVAALLRSTPGLTVDVQVHTGHRSNPAFYRELSERRAAVVRQHLVERGVPPAQLEAHGLGAACLEPSHGRRSGRADAQRVQFVVLSPGSEGGHCVPQDPSATGPSERPRRRR